MDGNYNVSGSRTWMETGKYKKLEELDLEMKREPLPGDYRNVARLLEGFVGGKFDVRDIPECSSMSELERWKKEKIRQILK